MQNQITNINNNFQLIGGGVMLATLERFSSDRIYTSMDTFCLKDIRLRKGDQRTPSPLRVESFVAQTSQEIRMTRDLLRHYEERKSPKTPGHIEFNWYSYNGLVPGAGRELEHNGIFSTK